MVSNSKSSKSKLLLAGVAGAGLLVAGGSQVATHADSVKVQSNDTVWALSQKFGVSIKSIESLNNINPQSHLIFSGQNLQIPDKKVKNVSVKKSQFSKVTVKDGDSLSSIASEYGVSVDSIVAANNLESNLIHVGQVLLVPVAGTPAANVQVQTVVQQPVVQQTVVQTPVVSEPAPASSVASVAPVSSVASQAPVSSVASVAPVSSVASQAPVSSVASVAPVSSVASQAPVSSTASVAPVSSVASQAPVSSTASVAPVSSVASQAPVSSTASVAPVSSVASQAPVSSAVSSTATTETTVSSAAQTPASSAASEQVQQSSAASQAPQQSSAVSQAPVSSAASQAPQQSSSAASQSSAANASSAASSANNTNENANVSGSVVSVARQLANNTIPYVWGGKTPAGFDCSGFVSYVYAHSTGQYLPSYTVSMESYVTDKSVSAANPGDLLFWGDHGSTYHVGIYLGNNEFAAAPQPGQNVQVEQLSSYFYPSFAGSVN